MVTTSYSFSTTLFPPSPSKIYNQSTLITFIVFKRVFISRILRILLAENNYFHAIYKKLELVSANSTNIID